jgi:predicted phosphoadenosine phosphosulfate sulfurtransferase
MSRILCYSVRYARLRAISPKAVSLKCFDGSEAKRRAPSWRRICKVLLKNDYWCKGLSFSQTKKALEKQVAMIMKYNEEL